jgi:hypothetical protein
MPLAISPIEITLTNRSSSEISFTARRTLWFPRGRRISDKTHVSKRTFKG